MERTLFPDLVAKAEQFNSSALLSATQKSALLLSYVSGAGLRKKVKIPSTNESHFERTYLQSGSPRAIAFAAEALTGHLRIAISNGEIIAIDGPDKGRVRTYEKYKWGNQLAGDAEPFKFLLLPIDGLGELASGEPGALSAVAAIAEDAIKVDIHATVPKYCVLVVGARICHEMLDTGNGDISRTIGNEPLPVGQYVDTLINHIYSNILSERKAHNRHAGLSPWILNIATVLRDSSRIEDRMPWFQTLPSRDIRIHQCCGSPFASAIKACIPSTAVDVFVGELSAFQTVFAAIAAEATGGTLFALPISESTTYGSDAKAWLSPSDFISDGVPAYLAATGINDSPVLKGVHQVDRGWLSTESILLDTFSHSLSIVQRLHNMDQCQFQRPKSVGSDEFQSVVLKTALDELNENVLKRI